VLLSLAYTTSYSFLSRQPPAAEASQTIHPSSKGDPHSSSQQVTDENEEACASLISENGAPRIRPSVNKFVNKFVEIPKISLPPTLPRRAAISLAERSLVGQFTRL